MIIIEYDLACLKLHYTISIIVYWKKEHAWIDLNNHLQLLYPTYSRMGFIRSSQRVSDEGVPDRILFTLYMGNIYNGFFHELD